MPGVAAGEAVQVFLQKNKCSYCTYLSLSREGEGWGLWLRRGRLTTFWSLSQVPKGPKDSSGGIFGCFSIRQRFKPLYLPSCIEASLTCTLSALHQAPGSPSPPVKPTGIPLSCHKAQSHQHGAARSSSLQPRVTATELKSPVRQGGTHLMPPELPFHCSCLLPSCLLSFPGRTQQVGQSPGSSAASSVHPCCCRVRAELSPTPGSVIILSRLWGIETSQCHIPAPPHPAEQLRPPGPILMDAEGSHHHCPGPWQHQTLLGRKAQCRSSAQLANKWLFCEGLLLMCFKWLSEWKM